MVTDVVAGTVEQPPVAGIVYVIRYVPAVLVFGAIAPVDELIVSPGVLL